MDSGSDRHIAGKFRIATPEVLLAEAVGRHRANDVVGANEFYEEILSRNPNHPQALNYSGGLVLAAGNRAEGLARLRRSIEIAPADVNILNNAAQALRSAGELGEAENVLRQSLAVASTNPNTLNLLGGVLMLKGDIDGAAAVFEKVLDQAPRHIGAAFNLGRLHLEHGRAVEAVRAFDRVLAIDPGDADTLYKKGEALMQLGKDNDAASCFEAVIAQPAGLQLDPMLLMSHLLGIYMRQRKYDAVTDVYRTAVRSFPSIVEVKAEFAVWLDWQHRSDEARSFALAALEQDSQHPRAAQVLARLEKAAGDVGAARRRLEDVPRNRWDQSTYFEMASIAESDGDFDLAFDCFVEINRLTGALPHFQAVDTERLPATLARTRAWSTPERVAASTGEVPDDGLAEPFFLVGFTRSGTTLLENVIGATDRVVISSERNFLHGCLTAFESMTGVLSPNSLETLDTEQVGALRQAYWTAVEKEMGGPLRADQRLLDKLPLNLIHLPLLRRMFPDAPILLALRDPRDVVISNFKQYFSPNTAMIHFLTLEGAVRMYVEVMELWLRYRGVLPGPWREVCYEDVVGTFDATVKGVLDFLGLPWDDAYCDFNKTSREQFVTTPSALDVATPIYSRAVGRWQGYAKQLAPHFETLAPVAKALGYPFED